MKITSIMLYDLLWDSAQNDALLVISNPYRWSPVEGYEEIACDIIDTYGFATIEVTNLDETNLILVQRLND